MPEPTRVVHIAGFPVRVGTKRRQRCAWCDALLVDTDLREIAVPESQDPEPGFWETGELVEVVKGDGITAYGIVSHTDGDPLPRAACAFPPAPPVKLEVVRG